jgi:hypothetical protein
MSSALARSRGLVAVAVVAVALAGAAAGCGGSASTGRPAAASAPRNAAAAWHQVVLCARAHGMPGLPDPQIDASGKAIFPNGLNVPERTRQACQATFDRLVPNTQNTEPTRAQLAALLRFARCMRSHGIPDWPDPRPDGSFHPDAKITNSLKSAFRSQLTACEHFNPDPRGRVYFNRS